MSKVKLIYLIEEYLKKINYKRNDNYKTYSIHELIKVCEIYEINLKFTTS